MFYTDSVLYDINRFCLIIVHNTYIAGYNGQGLVSHANPLIPHSPAPSVYPNKNRLTTFFFPLEHQPPKPATPRHQSTPTTYYEDDI